MLMTNQTQQFKQLVSSAKPETQIPKSPQQLVPRNAVIQRDESSQLVGISAVSGG